MKWLRRRRLGLRERYQSQRWDKKQRQLVLEQRTFWASPSQPFSISISISIHSLLLLSSVLFCVDYWDMFGPKLLQVTKLLFRTPVLLTAPKFTKMPLSQLLEVVFTLNRLIILRLDPFGLAYFELIYSHKPFFYFIFKMFG